MNRLDDKKQDSDWQIRTSSDCEAAIKQVAHLLAGTRSGETLQQVRELQSKIDKFCSYCSHNLDIRPDQLLAYLLDLDGISILTVTRATGIEDFNSILNYRRDLTPDEVTRVAKYFQLPEEFFVNREQDG